MLPLELTLEGFQGYLEPQTIDFTHRQKIAITGPFGSGKSSIFDGIGFALYGATRFTALDSIIHTAATSATVELRFLIGETEYKIRRTLTRRGRSTSHKAYLWRMDPDTSEWTEAGDSSGLVGGTAEAIHEILPMSWAAFRATILIEQGKSGAFTTEKPQRRFDIMADILELDVYQRMADAAAEDRRAAVKARDTDTAKLDAAQTELDDTAQAPAELKAATKAHAQAETARTAAEKTAAEAETAHAAITERWQATQASLRDHQHEVTAAQTALESAQYRAQTAAGQVRAAEGTITDLQQQITAAGTEKDNAVAQLRQRIQDTQTRLDALPDTEATVNTARATITQAQESIAGLRQRVEQGNYALQTAHDREREAAERAAGLAVQKDQALAELNAEKARARQYQAALDHAEQGNCPTCGQNLDPQTLQHLLDTSKATCEQVITRGKDLAAKIEAATGDRAGFASQVRDVQAGIRDCEQQIREHESTVQGAQQQISDAQVTAETARNYAEKIHADTQQLEQLTGGHSTYDQRVQDLDARITQTREQLDELRETARAAQEAVSAAEKRQQELAEADVPDLTAIEAEGAQAKAARDAARAAVTEAAQAVSDAAAHLAVLSERVERRKACAATVKALQKSINAQDEEIAVLGHVVDACSRGGTPKLVMNQAIAGINEDLANQLARFSGGTMTAELATEREQKSGSVKDELNLTVTGADGAARPYETFSGGQQFIVDLALHLALAKVLKDRSGAVIDMLGIDEGTTAIDPESRGPIIGVIQEVADEFGLTMMVTHDPEVIAVMPANLQLDFTGGVSHATYA